MSYPWTWPTGITPNNIEFCAKTLTTKHNSGYTGRSQIIRYQAGQWSELNLRFAPMVQSQAKQLTGFLNGLQGTYGTFYFTIPAIFRLGGAVGVTVAANGNDVTVTTGSATVGAYGTEMTTRRLVTFGGDGSNTNIFPALSSGSYTIQPTSGSLFRLASNEVRFTVNDAMEYGFTVPVIEASF